MPVMAIRATLKRGKTVSVGISTTAFMQTPSASDAPVKYVTDTDTYREHGGRLYRLFQPRGVPVIATIEALSELVGQALNEHLPARVESVAAGEEQAAFIAHERLDAFISVEGRLWRRTAAPVYILGIDDDGDLTLTVGEQGKRHENTFLPEQFTLAAQAVIDGGGQLPEQAILIPGA